MSNRVLPFSRPHMKKKVVITCSFLFSCYGEDLSEISRFVERIEKEAEEIESSPLFSERPASLEIEIWIGSHTQETYLLLHREADKRGWMVFNSPEHFRYIRKETR